MVVKRRGLVGVLGCLLVLASGFTAAPAHASAVRHVPGDHPTIAAALAASAPGDSVVVAPGTYVENVTVPSGVTLTSSSGPSMTTIDGGRAGTVGWSKVAPPCVASLSETGARRTVTSAGPW